MLLYRLTQLDFATLIKADDLFFKAKLFNSRVLQNHMKYLGKIHEQLTTILCHIVAKRGSIRDTN